MAMSKDYRIEFKVKNALLYNAMIAAGYKTASELARAAKSYPGIIGTCLNLKLSLYTKGGEIRPVYKKLSVLLRTLPEDLLPEQHHYLTLETNTASIELGLDEMTLLMAPDQSDALAITHQKSDAVMAVLDTLLPREKRILELKFGLDGNYNHTLQEIAEKEGVTTERIRQIEGRAFMKLKHPSRGEELRLHLKEYGDE